MSATTIHFIQRLVESLPALNVLLAEHLEDNFGEILPHIFIADVARWAVAEFLGKAGHSLGECPHEGQSLLLPLLSFLEDSYEKEGSEIEELISVSFLEHLPRPNEEAGWRIRDLLGPKLKDQLELIG